MKGLKDIFKTRLEFLEMTFTTKQCLEIHGDKTNRDYTIKVKQLEQLGHYLDSEAKHLESVFTINIALRHILGVNKICDMIGSNFYSAMERCGENSCVTFLFTHSFMRDFKFIIGIDNVSFTAS